MYCVTQFASAYIFLDFPVISGKSNFESPNLAQTYRVVHQVEHYRVLLTSKLIISLSLLIIKRNSQFDVNTQVHQ